MADYTKFGTLYAPYIHGPGGGYAIVFGEDGSFKVVKGPTSSSQAEVFTATSAGFTSGRVQLAKVHIVANQTIANNTTTVLSWTNVAEDTSNFFNAGNPGRFTVPSAGVYSLSARAMWTNAAGATAGDREMYFRLNGTTHISGTNQRSMSAVIFQATTLATFWRFAAGDFVECQVGQSSGGNLDIVGVALPNIPTYFTIAKIGD